MSAELFTVLLAEDDEHEIIAVKRAWKKSRIANPLQIVNDGVECLDYLKRRGNYAGDDAPPMPGLLLLDLKMPRLGGHEVLREIRGDHALRLLPVVILTTSDLDEDKLQSYGGGANAYVRKPIGIDALAEGLAKIRDFWQLTELPPPFPT